MNYSFKDRIEKYSALQSNRVKITDFDISFYNEKGQLHREDGPALEYVNGTKCWYINGNLHKEDGPAIEMRTGNKRWFLNNIEYSKKEYNNKIAARKNY